MDVRNSDRSDLTSLVSSDIYLFINQKNHCDLVIQCLEEQIKKQKHIGLLLKEGSDTRLFFNIGSIESELISFLENRKMLLMISEFYAKWGPLLTNISFKEIKNFIKKIFSGIENNERWRTFWENQKRIMLSKKEEFDPAYILEQIAGAFFYKILSIWSHKQEMNETLKIKHAIFTKSAHFDLKKVKEFFSDKLKKEIHFEHCNFLIKFIEMDKRELSSEYTKMITRLTELPLFKMIIPDSNTILSNYAKEWSEKISIISSSALVVSKDEITKSMKTSNPSSRSSRSPQRKKDHHHIIRREGNGETSPRQAKGFFESSVPLSPRGKSPLSSTSSSLSREESSGFTLCSREETNGASLGKPRKFTV